MPRKTNGGFTLLELIITVAIIGILAAVAIPVYTLYTMRSKASEAFTILQGIRDREEAYFTEYRAYTADIGYTPRNCGDSSDTAKWPGTGDGDAWRNLGFWPDGPTYYSYRVVSPYDAQGNFSSEAYDPAGDHCDQAHEVDEDRPWVAAEACGDIDADNNLAHFVISSANRTVCHVEEEESEY